MKNKFLIFLCFFVGILSGILILHKGYSSWEIGGVGESTYTAKAVTGNQIAPNESEAVAYYDSLYFSTIEAAVSSATNVINNSNNNKTIYIIPGTNPTIEGIMNEKTNVKELIIPEKLTLCLPYEGTTRENRNGTSDNFADAPGDTNISAVTYLKNVRTNRKNSITVSAGVNIQNFGTIQIGGIVGHEGQGLSGATSGSYCEIVLSNNSAIINNNSGKIECLGYIKKSSADDVAEIANKGSIYAPFVVYDYRGGSSTGGTFLIGNVCPFNVFDMPNIQCTVTTSYSTSASNQANGKVYGYADLYTGEVDPGVSIGNVQKVPAQHNFTTVNVIGNSNSIINLSNGSSVSSTYTPYLFGTTSKSDEGGRTNITFNGNVSNGTLSLSVNVMNEDISVSTVNTYFPICRKYDVIISSGTTTLNNKLKFMTGSSLLINNGASLINNGAVIFYDSFVDTSSISPKYPNKNASFCHNNGKLIVNDGCGIAGKIITSSNHVNGNDSDGICTIGNGCSLHLKSSEGTGAFNKDGLKNDALNIGVQIFTKPLLEIAMPYFSFNAVTNEPEVDAKGLMYNFEQIDENESNFIENKEYYSIFINEKYGWKSDQSLYSLKFKHISMDGQNLIDAEPGNNPVAFKNDQTKYVFTTEGITYPNSGAENYIVDGLYLSEDCSGVNLLDEGTIGSTLYSFYDINNKCTVVFIKWAIQENATLTVRYYDSDQTQLGNTIIYDIDGLASFSFKVGNVDINNPSSVINSPTKEDVISNSGNIANGKKITTEFKGFKLGNDLYSLGEEYSLTDCSKSITLTFTANYESRTFFLIKISGSSSYGTVKVGNTTISATSSYYESGSTIKIKSGEGSKGFLGFGAYKCTIIATGGDSTQLAISAGTNGKAGPEVSFTLNQAVDINRSRS